ncbi:hypothetical protein [Marinigracilibium pacificum]|uniref:Acetyltransferase (GNAT) family protein n=1 Tax=Marinigracilibium pacificum TaxID=2729599 RepID=A0A848IYC5_9BACT|nr:hypothetical protein [Marinigracilibium pacificum]NMM48636.1 hypothetical protein [Marinigracilibium pacificum]
MSKWSFDIIDGRQQLDLGQFSLFETDRYLNCKTSYSIRLILRKGEELFGHISFTIQDDVLISGYRASYGGFYLRSFPGTEVLRSFVEQAITIANQTHCKKIIIRQPPEFIYREVTPWVNALLKEQGFGLTDMKIHHHLDLKDEQLFQKYLKGKHGNRLKNVDSFELVEKPSTEWEEFYDYIRAERDRKGYKLSLTREQLEEQVKCMPDDHVFYELVNKENHDVVVKCVSLKINEDLIYNFYPAYSPGYSNVSPYVVFLFHQARNLKSNSYNFIDLGTSMNEDFIQNDLADFKSSIGGKPSVQLNWLKEI